MTATISGDGTSTLINLTTSGNTVLGDASTDTLNVGNGGLVKDASGNVGIGTASPLVPLHVVSTGTSTSAFGNVVSTFRSGATGRDASIQFSDGTNTGNIGQLSGNLVLGNGGNERMRIDTSGNLLVGTTSAIASERFNVTGSVATGFVSRIINQNATNPQGMLLYYSGASPNNSSAPFLYCLDSTTLRAELRSNGGLANFSANNVNLSDERTKTDIQNAGGYLAKICAIPVRTFKYKDQADDLLNLGVIAQEVEAIAPELVDVSGFGETPEDGVPLKAIYQTDLQYALMKCIQEQQALIQTLTDRITALENK